MSKLTNRMGGGRGGGTVWAGYCCKVAEWVVWGVTGRQEMEGDPYEMSSLIDGSQSQH